MPVETAEDRAGMLEDWDEVTIDDGANPPNTFMGIFDNAYFEADLGDGPPVGTRQPMFLAQTSDVAPLPVDTRLLVKGAAYLLKETQPDGTGFSTVVLELA